MTGRDRLLVVARPHDLSSAPFDGFVRRRHEVMTGLLEGFDPRIVLLRPPHDSSRLRADYEQYLLTEIPIHLPDMTRSARLRRALRPDRDTGHGDALASAVAHSGARIAVTFGPWLDIHYEPVFAALPTVHFFEEDLATMVEIAPQSARARMFRRAERWTRAQLASHQPAAVACISMTEIPRARQIWPRSEAFWHPYVVDPGEFPLASGPSEGDAAVCVGHFGEPRNAEGLAAVAEHLEPPPQILLASGAGVSPSLAPFLDDGRLTLAPRDADVYDLYRNAALTVVPATRVTGVKTTVLQAWAAGCPVVCFRASALSIGTFANGALIVATGPEHAARAIQGLVGDRDERARLARAGRSVLERHFSQSTTRSALTSRLRSLI